MVILGREDIREVNPDPMAIRVFLKALELVGGPRKIIEYRNLTWIPSLLQASYAVVLVNEYGHTAERVAEELGLTVQTVRNMLRSDPALVREKLEDELKAKEIKVHTAGGLALWAYEEIKKGNDSVSFLESAFERVSDVLDIAWPVEVLRRLRGIQFPVYREDLGALLRGVRVEGKPVEDLLPHLPAQLHSPAELLKALKEAAGHAA